MIKLSDIKNIATIIKTKYGNNLYKMNFIFCVQKDANSYFIFQEIQGMPIRRIVYHESNNSVTFTASWSAWANPFAIVADANCEQIENWKDVLDRSRPYNSYIDVEGGFNKQEWKSVDKINRTEKKKRHKHKTDTFVEFRVDRIQRAIFNEWGFELYSPTISMIGFKSRHSFPHEVFDVPGTSDDEFDDDGPTLDENEVFAYVTTWQGGTFRITEFENNSDEISQISAESNAFFNYDLSSYWDINESDEENEKFDEEMASVFLDEREDDETIFDVGQKKVNLYFDD